MTDDPIATVKVLDVFWSEGRFDDLADILADDVVVVGAHGRRFAGRDAVLAGYRDFRAMAEVKAFTPENYVANTHGDASVVEYVWAMQWVSGEQAHNAKGREILALARENGVWKVFWRTQIQLPA
jgi:ketosteroid isomerase-like protein